jgi:crossover junction endodeoxyribonuclease RuvC
VLGIDPGLDRTGYAIVEWPARSVLDAGLIRSSPALPLGRRLAELEQGIEEVLAEHELQLVAVEDLYAHYAHPRTAILMGHARGVMLLAAARHRIEVISLSATQIKKTLTGSGHAGKPQVQRAIAASLRLSRIPEPADVADAMAAALCAGLVASDARLGRSSRAGARLA